MAKAKSALSQGLIDNQQQSRAGFNRFHIDWPLLTGLIALSMLGLVILYSGSGENWSTMTRQMIWMCIAFSVMLFVAQIPPYQLEFWTPWVYGLGLLLLVATLVFGEIGKGAQRWINLGFFRIQPSELMKFAVPMMVAWYMSEKSLPPSPKRILIALLIIAAPVALIAKQPDLGTSILVGSAGVFV
ncbi:MAG: FtsW/RodA/SpoVE family cell cycle protein, partial [Gammaproteobacteria bacterium]|nr:FtsW/RodA/SpoVE family cell cycle protein [Gammaproteobacteria bacterium]